MLIQPYFSYIFYTFFLKWYHTIITTDWHVVSKYLSNERWLCLKGIGEGSDFHKDFGAALSIRGIT